jgi:hypothetical protein
MITMHPFQTTEKYDFYHFTLTGKKTRTDWIPLHRELAELVEYSGVDYAVVYLNDIWIYLHPNKPAIWLLTRIASEIGARFLSRMELQIHLTGMNSTKGVEEVIDMYAHHLFNQLHLQRDMFSEDEPKFDCLRYDLQTGLWIT